jgi:prepilin-type N-terminal cleavage/methylation domain-containing protein
MPLLRRRGFTLVELLIAMVLLGIFATGLYKVLLNNQRTFAAQTQRIDLQQNIRAAATILPGEFREMDAGDSDIIAMDTSSITIRAMRQLAFICDAPVLGAVGNISFTVRQALFFGDRQYFQGGDSILAYWEGNPNKRTDDNWVRGAVVSEVSQNCTDGKAGYRVVATPVWTATVTNTAGAVTAGAPVRGYSTMTYKLWQSSSDNQWYLAQQVGAGTTQPLVGPLMGANGLRFTYYDTTGTTVTATRNKVALIDIKLRARTAQMVRAANEGALAYKYDSVSIRVALRNSPRCGVGSLPLRQCL